MSDLAVQEESLQRAVESQLKMYEEKTTFLAKRYQKYIDSAAEVYEEVKGRRMPKNLKWTLAVCLENTRELLQKQRAMEQSYTSDVAFANFAFDIVSVIVPSLITEEIVSVQPMERRKGEIYFMEIVADRAKGSTAVGSSVLSSLYGYRGKAYFSSNTVQDETVRSGTAQAAFITASAVFFPIVANSSFTIHSPAKTGITTTALATLTAATGVVYATAGTAYVTYANGRLRYKFAAGSGPTAGQANYAVYVVDLEKTTTAIGKVKISLTSQLVTAKTRKLNAEWLMDAAYDLMKAHGRDAEKEILIALTGEIKADIDNEIILDLYNGGNASTGLTWNSASSSSVPFVWHKNSLIDALLQGSFDIYASTKRGTGTWLVAGTQFAKVIESLDQFESAVTPGQEIVGPYFAGVLSKRWKVYVSPDIPAKKLIQGYLGDTYLKSGYVFAPYLPIFTTPTYGTMDFVVHKGLGTSYGTKMINSKMYSVMTYLP